jgi:uncharacterized protein
MSEKTTIRTHSGIVIDILSPYPFQISIDDIAHSLSHQCRFNGHVDTFYSVAQHSVMISEMLPEKYKLAALLHDAAEAYLGDVVRPLKHLLPQYISIEDNMMQVIAKKFNLQYPLPDIIKEWDNSFCNSELILYFDNGGGISWTPEQAKIIFLDTFHKLFQ